MAFNFALFYQLLLKALILAGSSSTVNADGNGEQQTNDVRNMKKSQNIEFGSLHLISPGLRALKEEDAKSLPTRETLNTESLTTFAPSISHKTLVPSPSSVSSFDVDSSQDWTHGSVAVVSEHGATIKINMPPATQVGDTLFLFLR
jgi:hypothetical protein